MTIKNTIIKTGMIGIVFCMCGCSSFPVFGGMKMPPSIQIAPSVSPMVNLPMAEEGSLWTHSSTMLLSDLKAHQVGDTVIVDIVENTSSSMNANTQTTRDSSMDAGVTNILGILTKLERQHPDLAPGNKLIGESVANSFKGTGTSDRKGQITASIAARVTEVFPNNNIVVYGRREMRVNNETQFISVAGIIRLADIDSINHVKSTYLADARIEYSGNGVIADKQKVGWFTRIFDNIWPF